MICDEQIITCKRMDAAAYLTSHGWRGHGHALHRSGRGITKPVHISQKADVLGVGKKQHDAYADQWWARAFDDTLKGLSMTANKVTEKVASDAQVSQIIGKVEPKWIGQGGLYSNFVKGESLLGTLKPEEKDLPESKPRLKNQRKQVRGSDDADLTAGEAKKCKWSTRKRRQREAGIAEHSNSLDLVAVQSDLKDIKAKQRGFRKTRAKRRNTESKANREQRKRERRARRVLKADETCEF